MLISLLLLASPAALASDSPSSLLGDWVTPNKSIVRVYKCEAAICAKIVHVNPAVGHTTDGNNPDTAKRNQPLCGLTIGRGFHPLDPAHAEGGKLYDPESGNTYSGTIWLASDTTLKLHGYIGLSLFGRTEDWHRAENEPPACDASAAISGQ